jgi:phage terminase small subunit
MQNAEAKSSPIKLSHKQKLFVEAYLRTWNATQSAIEAGYSKKTAGAIGSENLTKLEIKAEIDRRVSEKIMSANEVMTRLSDIARASHMPFVRFSEDGFVYFNFADPEAQKYFHLIKKIKTKRQRKLNGHGDDAEMWEGEWVEVELYDAQAALLTMAKYHNLITDKVDITSNGEKILDDKQIDRAISTLADAIGKVLPGESSK